jgi:hypothetical protein
VISKRITYCGKSATIACDARCDKAWGRNSRPRVRRLPDGGKDFDAPYAADEDLGTAPEDPGTYEGGEGKPLEPEARLNRWCCRECERCWMSPPGRPDATPELPVFLRGG